MQNRFLEQTEHMAPTIPPEVKAMFRGRYCPLIMSEDFWDKLKLATLVLKPVLVALRYCDGMKGGTVSLLYNLLLELDKYYSKPIKGLDDSMCFPFTQLLL
jgi:hypothetical protein